MLAEEDEFCEVHHYIGVGRLTQSGEPGIRALAVVYHSDWRVNSCLRIKAGPLVAPEMDAPFDELTPDEFSAALKIDPDPREIHRHICPNSRRDIPLNANRLLYEIADSPAWRRQSIASSRAAKREPVGRS